ncbi:MULTISPECIES: response regulator transcription factor [unclassified Mesorhizobium]|uniref:response regulator transcription factor n=1 Tax=unclassified Mesorhizobium TaxID=325217 RepID=UPI001FD880DA|nr:response regulator transcription factor [Mesorhizobium sp. LNJC403B00]
MDRQTAGLSARLRATSSPLGIIYILQPNGGFDFNEIPKLDADGLLMDGISHSYLVECANAVAGGRKWVDDHILQHLLTPRSLPQRAPKLTGRETEVAGLVSRGLRNKIIAQRLHVSEGTVKMHLHHVYEKLRLGSRAELAWATFGDGADHLGPGHKSGL